MLTEESDRFSLHARGLDEDPGAQPSGTPGEHGGKLVDQFLRPISYLRVSLTDQCNLRCTYCTPRKGAAKLAQSELLTYEEILRLVSLTVGMGIRKVRLTGGEPLVRRHATEFIKSLAAIHGLDDIRLTTNGLLLQDSLQDLYDAGLRKLNISLDTLQPARYREITGVAAFDRVWQGIRSALQKGFSPVKINVVAMRGINDDEFIEFGRLTLTEPLQVRFIEFMPMGKNSRWDEKKYMASEEIMDRLQPLGRLEARDCGSREGPARVYRLPGAVGSLGFISPLSNHFCDKCNRLRLTADGRLRSCLLTDRETDIKKYLRAGATDAELQELVLQTILQKPRGHSLSGRGEGSCHGEMSRIGG